MTRLTAILVAALALLPAVAAAQAPPSIDSPAGIVMETTSGDVPWAKNADARRPIASTTKLMTALLTLEEADLDDVVTAPRYRLSTPAESVVGLIPGEKITVRDLVRALLVDSANDAAYTLALHVGGTVPQFVRRMNERALQLGLTNTSYANPIGLDDPDNYSSARDLAALTLVLRKNQFFRETVKSTTVTLESGGRPRTLTNTNKLLTAQRGIDGVKTGFTNDAGEVLVSSVRRKGVSVVAVVLGASTEAIRNQESLNLLNFGVGKYERMPGATKGEVLGALPIVDRDGAVLSVVAARNVTRVVKEGEEFDRVVDLPDDVEGPIAKGQKLGELVVNLRGEPVARVRLISSIKVPAAGTGRRIQRFLTQPWLLLVLGGLLLLSTAFTHRRSAPPRERTA